MEQEPATTQLSRREYMSAVANGQRVCPNCKADESRLSFGSFETEGPHEISQQVFCGVCHHDWREFYSLTSAGCLQDESGEDCTDWKDDFDESQPPTDEIRVIVKDGTVTDVLGVPPGLFVAVRDYDVNGPDDKLKTDHNGDDYAEYEWKGN